ncbi:coiled-coil domain-containing protein 125 isoform X2 [Lingula anatina]|uniref:Coiled-coil domain-containing protein 125 isoform X1 n=1 Tax=Lingula anatina TaxID=7574 RepID=A0A1S3KE23_LINAN|nr:coiled-coil domain-containing protein 125 isoform X1 [Lingula anatina]XP_013420502.1 coiled-coil domain-containing protein 125 isoform X2 [Lingula anatina]|eukprot:XP_013420501.1 coiled-coil domain-containing protein 125 isoform X1 [Lingula anatina]
MDEGQDKKEYIEEDDVGGDLGLGEGFCSGNVSSESGSGEDKPATSAFVESLTRAYSDPGDQSLNTPIKTKISERIPNFFSREKSEQLLKPQVGKGAEESFPKFGDVPMGTSLKQHRQLCQQNLKEIYDKNASMNYTTGRKQKNVQDEEPSKDQIERKLTIALEDVDQLKQELETCQRKLNAKQEAIKILQKQVEQDQGDSKALEKKSKELYHDLEKPPHAVGDRAKVEKVHSLSQPKAQPLVRKKREEDLQTKCDRVCQENSCLLACLDRKAEEIRKLQAEKMGLSRQRDELLALMDVKERNKYESIHAQAEEKYNDYSTDELSILGACHCRVSNPEPCGCAHAAANLNKELVRLKEEVDTHKQRRDEAYNTVEAYRVAFEEQLNRNKLLTNQITELATMPPQQQKIKVKNVIKWIAGQLTEENLPPPSSMLPQEQAPPTTITISGKGVNINCSSEQELIQSLLDMLNDKSNALAHQKLAAQMLASKTQELERQLRETNLSLVPVPPVTAEEPTSTTAELAADNENIDKYSQSSVKEIHADKHLGGKAELGTKLDMAAEKISEETETKNICTDDVLDYETCL